MHKVIARAWWTTEEAREVLDALDASSLTVSEFAVRYAAQAQRVFAGRRKLAEQRTLVSTPSFIEITTVSPSRPVGRYEPVLSSGDTLRVEGELWHRLRSYASRPSS